MKHDHKQFLYNTVKDDILYSANARRPESWLVVVVVVVVVYFTCRPVSIATYDL